MLVLVTDGQVGNEDQILQRIGARLAGIRVHVVGIDRAVNAGFLGRLAAAGRGRCELVESEDRLDEAADAHPPPDRRAAGHRPAHWRPTGCRSCRGRVAPSPHARPVPRRSARRDGPLAGQSGGTVAVGGTSSDGTPFGSIRAAAATGGSPASTAAWARAHLRDLEDRYAA